MPKVRSFTVVPALPVSGVYGSSAKRNFPARSLRTELGTAVLLPASMQGEFGFKRKSPEFASIKQGSALMLLASG